MGADQSTDWRAAAASALDWWHDAGVDLLVGETPHDWLAPPAPAALVPAAPRTAEAAPPGTTAMPATLAGFLAWRTGPEAPEAGWRGPTLGPEGDPAGLFVVTDVPEREDVAAGRLMSGAQGRLLDRMLSAIGRTREGIHLVPVATARPAGGRLGSDEAARLGAVLRHHLFLARPRAALLLGEAASRAMLGMNCAEARGRLHTVNHDGAEVVLVPSFHPRLLLERPAAKADAWRDLRMLMRVEAA